LKYATKKILRDYTATVTIAVVLAILIRTYLVEAYRIPSQSMKPQLLAGDTIFVGKWPQKLDQNILPSRGDVVVFTNSAGTTAKSSDYIRRVVGLPGDVLTLKAGHLFLNGKSLLVKEKESENPSCFVEKLSKNI
jgi:signal peptidase I